MIYHILLLFSCKDIIIPKMKGTVKDLYSMYSKAGNYIGDSPQAAVV